MGILFSVDDLVNFGDNDAFSFGDGSNDSPFSVSARIKMSVLSNPQSILSKWNITTGNPEWAIFWNSTNNGINITLRDASTGGNLRYASAINSVNSINTEYHVVMTYDGSGSANGINVYINSAIDTPSSRVTDGTYIAMENKSEAMRLGVHTGAGSAGRYFNGEITKSAIWDIELSLEDAVNLYNFNTKAIPLQVQRANLIAYWPLDDGEAETSADGETITDLSGNGHDGIGDNGANNIGLTWKAEANLKPTIPVLINNYRRRAL